MVHGLRRRSGDYHLHARALEKAIGTQMTTEQYINAMRSMSIDRGALEHGAGPSELKTIGSIDERRQGYRTDTRTSERGKHRVKLDLDDLSHMNPDGWRARGRQRKRSDGAARL